MTIAARLLAKLEPVLEVFNKKIKLDFGSLLVKEEKNGLLLELTYELDSDFETVSLSNDPDLSKEASIFFDFGHWLKKEKDNDVVEEFIDSVGELFTEEVNDDPGIPTRKLFSKGKKDGVRYKFNLPVEFVSLAKVKKNLNKLVTRINKAMKDNVDNFVEETEEEAQ